MLSVAILTRKFYLNPPFHTTSNTLISPHNLYDEGIFQGNNLSRFKLHLLIQNTDLYSRVLSPWGGFIDATTAYTFHFISYSVYKT